jgi:hypothetical protein
MRAAAKLNVLYRRRATLRVRFHVVKFEKRRLAASALTAHERTAGLIALRNGALDGSGYVTSRYRTFIPIRSRRRNCGKPAPFDVLDEDGQCTIQNRAHVASRMRMPEQPLRVQQFVVRLARQGHVQSAALWRKWRYDYRVARRQTRAARNDRRD